MSDDERAVLGDELQQRGDPQGELIGVQLALEALPASAPPARRNLIERKIATLLDQHHDTLYGPLAPHVMRLSQPDVRFPAIQVKCWRGGFADDIRVQRTLGQDLVDILAVIRTLPIARFVRRLELGAGDHVAAVADLARAPLPSVRALVLDDGYKFLPELPSERVKSARTVDATGLDTLEIKYSVEVDVDALPVRRLELYQYYASPPMRTFDLDAPALEDLQCYWFHLDRGFLTRYPALRRLSIGGEFEAGWLEAFLRSSMIERMETISLGSLNDADLVTICNLGERIAHVQRFEVTGYLTVQGRAAVADRLPRCLRYK